MVNGHRFGSLTPMKLFAKKADSPDDAAPAVTSLDAAANVEQVGDGTYSARVLQLPPPALTSEQVKSVRFDVSEPQGYYFPQVEQFLGLVQDALAAHESARFQMEQRAHSQQVDLDHAAYDNQRLRTEIELFRVQGSPMVNPDGSYVTESQAAESSTQVAAIREQLAASEEQRLAHEAKLQAATDHAHQQDQEIQGLRARDETMRRAVEEATGDRARVAADLTALHEQHAATTAELEERNTAHTELAAAHDAVQTQLATANESLEAVTAERDLLAGQVAGFLDQSPTSSASAHAEPDPALTAQIASLSAEAAELKERLATLNAHNDELATANQEWESAYARLQANHQQATAIEPEQPTAAIAEATPGKPAPAPTLSEPEEMAAAPDAAEAPVEASGASGSVSEPEPDEVVKGAVEEPVYSPSASEEEKPQVVSVIPIESELPPGTELPGTREAVVDYPPAAPGLPLSNGEVPVRVYAPELDPRIQAQAHQLEAEQEDRAASSTDEPDNAA